MLSMTESVGPFRFTETATGDRDVNKLLFLAGAVAFVFIAIWALTRLDQ
jgi:hypothetical protein